MFCNSHCNICAFSLAIFSISASVSPPSTSINCPWGVLGFCGERFTGIFAGLRLETATKGEFGRDRKDRERGLLRRSSLVLSIGDLSTIEPFSLRFVKSPGETNRVGCDRVRGSPFFHQSVDIHKHIRPHRIYVPILSPYFTEANVLE
jgi:hypothetical protein